MSALRSAIQRRFEAWLDKRNPRRNAWVLSQNKIFIFPSSAGLGFLLMLSGLLLLAINYQNNLIFALAFLLFSLLLVVILHTYTNLSGLQIRAGACEPVFAGDTAHFHVHINSQQRPRFQLQVGFPQQRKQVSELAKGEGVEVRVPCPAPRRGRLYPGRIQVRSDYPLGVIRCWAMPALDWHCLVYPRPRALRPLMSSARGDGHGEVFDMRSDSDEFSGFERYQPGESPRRIFWKAYAKGQGLFSKRYEESRADDLSLDWESLSELAVEDRLSTLCAWALECDRRELPFSLHLPTADISAGQGPAHLAAVLRELAIYPAEAGR